VEQVQVEVVCAELGEAALDRPPDVCRRRSTGAGDTRDRHSKLGGDDDLVAPMAEGRTEKRFGLPVAVVVRSVEDLDSGIESLVDHQPGTGPVESAAEVVASQADDRNLQASQSSRPHTVDPFESGSGLRKL
jgi:hypothetical protein